MLRPAEARHATIPAELLARCRAAEGRVAHLGTEADAATIDALMRELDGDHALRALPPAAPWRSRLLPKLRDALRLRRGGDPWDRGWLRGVDALAHFKPRWPTLIVSPIPLRRRRWHWRPVSKAFVPRCACCTSCKRRAVVPDDQKCPCRPTSTKRHETFV